MKKIADCRRSKIAILAICCLTTIGLKWGSDLSGIAIAISGIVGAVAGSNAWQNKQTTTPISNEETK